MANMKKQTAYEVESIRDRAIYKGEYFYEIKWKGFDNECNTWQPKENLQGVIKDVEAFDERFKKAKKTDKVLNLQEQVDDEDEEFNEIHLQRQGESRRPIQIEEQPPLSIQLSAIERVGERESFLEEANDLKMEQDKKRNREIELKENKNMFEEDSEIENELANRTEYQILGYIIRNKEPLIRIIEFFPQRTELEINLATAEKKYPEVMFQFYKKHFMRLIRMRR